MDEEDLEAEINSLISHINSATFDQTKISAPIETIIEPHAIEKQITKLKKELCDTQSMFVNAKNLLAGISFENVDENFANEVSAVGEKCQSLLNEQCDDETNFFDSLCNVMHQCHDIPELHAMVTAVQELKGGISKMEANHLLLADLYEDVWKSVACSDSDNASLMGQDGLKEELSPTEPVTSKKNS